MTLEYATSPADMKLNMEGVGKGAIVKDNLNNKEVDVFEFKEDEES